MENQPAISYPNQKAAQLLIEGLCGASEIMATDAIRSQLRHYANVCGVTFPRKLMIEHDLLTGELLCSGGDYGELLRYSGRLPTEEQMARAFQTIYEIAKTQQPRKGADKNENRSIKTTDQGSD